MPQGGPLSPLLSNILLDNLIILVKSKRSGERVMENISRFLEKKLKVQVNRDKSKVVRAEASTFLGFTFTGKRLTVSEKSLGLSNAYLTKQGLPSMRTLWIKIYPVRKRCFSGAVTV
ncbi:MAG: hypothetical protein AABZ10_13185 [Nitrospirota bacterium]